MLGYCNQVYDAASPHPPWCTYITGTQLVSSSLVIRYTKGERLWTSTIAKRMWNDSLTNWTIPYRIHSVLQTFRHVSAQTLEKVGPRKKMCILKKFSSPERFVTFARDRVTSPTHAERWKNDYERIPTLPRNSENARRALAKNVMVWRLLWLQSVGINTRGTNTIHSRPSCVVDGHYSTVRCLRVFEWYHRSVNLALPCS